MKNIKRIFVGVFFSLFFTSSIVSAQAITAGVISATQSSDTTFTITVSGLVAENGISNVYCDVWSAKNSKDDIKNNEMFRNDDGSYTYTVDVAAQHNGEKGGYYIDISVKDGNGSTEAVGSTYSLMHADANEWKRFEWDGSALVEKTYKGVLSTDPVIKKNTEEANAGEKFKSGYGYSFTLNSSVSSNAEIIASETITSIQNAAVVFPEFNYKSGVTIGGSLNQYNRLLEITDSASNGAVSGTLLEFKANPFSAGNKRVHFTPLIYPDNTEYKVYAEVFDAWTPGGMLSTSVTQTFTVDGNVYDDWQINQKR